MIVSKKTTKELSDFLDYINNENNEIDVSQPEVVDLLIQLKKIDKKRINAVIKKYEGSTKKSPKKLIQINLYTKEEVAKIFDNYNTQKIKENYSLKDLQSMYYTIYNRKTPSSKTKDGIINALAQYFGMTNRAKAFFN